jgi:ferritin
MLPIPIPIPIPIPYFQDVAKPNVQEWNSPLEAIEAQLALEQSVHKQLLELHKTAETHGDR